MITGVVMPQREAVLSLTIQNAQGHYQETEAVLDTGFTGYLTLPTALVRAMGLPSAGRADATLGDGSIISLGLFRATVLWNGSPRSVTVLEAVGGPLVGMQMLYGHRVTLDVVDGGNVTIESLPGGT